MVLEENIVVRAGPAEALIERQRRSQSYIDTQN